MGLEQAWLALIGAIMGTSGLKLVEHILNRANTRNEMATALRTELRGEIEGLKKELAETEKQLDEWKQKYWDLMSKYVELQTNKAQGGTK
jgi:chromosome segregation ATPase